MPTGQPDLGNFSVETLFQMIQDLSLTFIVGKCIELYPLACSLGGFDTLRYGNVHWRVLEFLTFPMPIFNDCNYNSESTDSTALVGSDGIWIVMVVAKPDL